MEGGSVHRMCRCCAAEGSFKDIKTTYHWMGDEEVYGDMLSECFDVKLITSDHGGICEMCITHLRNAANFKKQVLETEEQFRKHLESGKFNRPPVVKQEFTMDDEMGESDDNMDNGEDDDYVPDFEVPIKTEDELDEPVKPRKRACKATTSRAKKSKTEEKNNDEPTKGKALKELSKQRHNIKQIMMFSNATPIRKHNDMGYACSFCENHYLDPAELKMHTIREHTQKTKQKFTHDLALHCYLIKLDITGLECNICQEKIDELDDLQEHLTRKHDKDLFSDIKKLTLPFKFDTESLKCAVCGITSLKTFKMLQLHMNTHFGNYTCKLCGSTFVNRAMLVNHTNSVHGTKFKCKYCFEVFKTEATRRTHIRSEHSAHCNALPYKCGHCDERFGNTSQKMKHLAAEHDIRSPTYDCQACDKKYPKPYMLKNHLERDHMLTKRFQCTECSMAFYYEFHLRSHIVSHTKAKDFPCNVCGKCFSRKKSLTEHLKIHNNDRRFKCSICEQSFVQKCSLKRHVETKH